MCDCRLSKSCSSSSYSPFNISETGRYRGFVPKEHRQEMAIRRMEWSRDRWRHVTLIGQTRDSNTLRGQYLENSWRCYLATITELWESTVGCLRDSLASCFVLRRIRFIVGRMPQPKLSITDLVHNSTENPRTDRQLHRHLLSKIVDYIALFKHIF